jgi:hypothetical protein
MPDRALTVAEVADLLRVSVAWFRRHRDGLRRDHGFPSPVPGLRDRYDPLAIEAWFARHRAGAAPAAEDAAPAPLDWDSLLDARALGQAAPAGRA